jgi:hypothetical protein
MLTISPERSTVSPVQPPTTEQLQVADIRDADGRLLVSVELTEPLEGDQLLLGEVDDGSLLMAYYFGRGGRDVMLNLANRPIHARLETCWQRNRRNWWLDLRQ